MRRSEAVRHQAQFVGPMDRILYLRSMPMFEAMAIEHLALLAEYLEERHIRQGQTVIPADRPVDTLHFVASGVVRATYRGVPIGVVEPPNRVGFWAALSQLEGGYEATAEVDTKTLALRSDVLLDVMEDDFQVALDAIRAASDTLLGLRDRLPAVSEQDQFKVKHPYPGRPLDLVERLVWMLSNSTVFENSNVDAVMAICRRQTERRWRDGERLWSTDERADFGLSILDGEVHLWGDTGQRAFTAGVGFGIGYLDGLAARGRYMHAEARGRVVGLVDEVETMVDIFEDNFDLARDLLATLTSNCLQVSALVAEQLE